jgi:hypothetical protein
MATTCMVCSKVMWRHRNMPPKNFDLLYITKFKYEISFKFCKVINFITCC